MHNIKPETAWCCVAVHGCPRPFIHESTVHAYREDSQKKIGESWMRTNETWRDGWRRAYRKGWRCMRVVISIPSVNGEDK